MSVRRTVVAGLRTLFRKDRVEQELADELQHYLVLATEEKVRRGMTPHAAERAARVEMGGLESAKTLVRSGRWESAVETLQQDLRVAVRGLSRSPAFAAAAIVSLALGLGATTSMFTIVNAVMLRPLPYAEPRRLAQIWTDDVRRGLHRERTAYLTITDWQAQNRSFSDIAWFSTERIATVAPDAGGERGRTRSAFVSPNLFTVLGASPIKGRLISTADDRERAPVAVISYAFWQRWFSGAGDVVGKTLTIDNASRGGIGALTVIGVLPPEFFFPDKVTEVWTPASTYWRFERERVERFDASARRWAAVGRLAPGVTIARAGEDLDRIGRHLAQAHPSSVPDFPGFAAQVEPVLDTIAGANLQSALWVLLGAVALVLLVVCANVANLQLARGAARQREFAVRRALGAGRGRLVRQLGAESMVLVVIGGVVGVGIAAWGTPLLAIAAANYLPRMDEVAIDLRVLLFAAIATLVSGLVFGIVPALRMSAADANEALREGGHGTATTRLRRSQGLLVLAECTMALVLLTGAGLLLKSLGRVQSVDPGFDPRNVLTLRLEFPSEAALASEAPASAPARGRARAQRADELLTRLQSLPGVEATGVTDDLFINGQGNESITIPGRAPDELGSGELSEAAASPGFFATLRVPMRRGRSLLREDTDQKMRALWSRVRTDLSLLEKERLATPEPVVVNEAFVRRFFPGEDPIGKRFCIDPLNKTYWYEIVGVAGDMHRSGLERATIPEYYGPWIPSPGGRADLLVRTTGDPLALEPTVRAEVRRLFPGASVVAVSTAETQLGGFTAQRHFQTWLLTAFAVLAVSLAALGIFGLSHYAVAEREREIGVRVALGATPGDVLRLVILQGMRMPAIGITVGLVLSGGLMRLISSQLYGVEPIDPATFAAVSVGLALISAGACYLAARGAARSDPIKALRL